MGGLRDIKVGKQWDAPSVPGRGDKDDDWPHPDVRGIPGASCPVCSRTRWLSYRRATWCRACGYALRDKLELMTRKKGQQR